MVPLSAVNIDQNAPRVPTNGAGTVYQLPDVSTVKEGVSLIIINKTDVTRNISLFAGDAVAGLLQIDHAGVWTVVAQPATNSWLSTFNLFSDLIENLNTNETDTSKQLRPDDHVTLYITNEDNTDDLDAVSAKIEVNRVS